MTGVFLTAAPLLASLALMLAAGALRLENGFGFVQRARPVCHTEAGNGVFVGCHMQHYHEGRKHGIRSGVRVHSIVLRRGSLVPRRVVSHTLCGSDRASRYLAVHRLHGFIAAGGIALGLTANR
jgi:hypothetical protein